MPDGRPDQNGTMQKHLNKALEEALSKTNLVFGESSQGSEGFDKKIWAAAESVEYASLLFSLAYNLEDVDPQVKKNRSSDDPIALVKESVGLLKRVSDMKERHSGEAYASLRTAAHRLKTAYLDQLKKTKRTR